MKHEIYLNSKVSIIISLENNAIEIINPLGSEKIDFKNNNDAEVFYITFNKLKAISYYLNYILKNFDLIKK